MKRLKCSQNLLAEQNPVLQTSSEILVTEASPRHSLQREQKEPVSKI